MIFARKAATWVAAGGLFAKPIAAVPGMMGIAFALGVGADAVAPYALPRTQRCRAPQAARAAIRLIQVSNIAVTEPGEGNVIRRARTLVN
jgi:hypothetical protein